MAHKTPKNQKKSSLSALEEFSDTVNLAFDGKQWQSWRDQFNSLKSKMPLHPINQLDDPRLKIIVVVVGRVPKVNGSNASTTQLMEDGRAAAQAAHAVSKLKLSYVLELCQQVPGNAYEYAQKVMNSPVTTIVVKARDAEEIKHVRRLTDARSLHSVNFHDDNLPFYGVSSPILTALAIGPYTNEYFDGITDYLPLWKSVYDPVS